MALRIWNSLTGRKEEFSPLCPGEARLYVCVESLVSLRQTARRQRDFAAADRLRHEIAQLGVLLEDTPGGTVWKLS